MSLSKRLTKCASFVKEGAVVRDVGTDHGLVPLYLIQNKIAKKVYASDLREEPLNQAKSNTKHINNDKLELILTDGIQNLSDDVDTVMISGMGGRLIADILSDPLKNVKKLILQPNMGSHIVREKLEELNFNIVNEVIIREKEQYYEIIVADIGKMSLTKKEKFFGPILVKEKSDNFKRMWSEELERVEYAMNHVPEYHENFKKLKEKFDSIQEVI